MIRGFWGALKGFAIMIIVVLSLGLVFDYLSNGEMRRCFPAIILSDSMCPTLKTGDLILLKDIQGIDRIQKGDIITFKSDNGLYITHRVTKITGKEEDRGYKTKGDANTTEDKKIVLEEDIIGIFYLKIPYIGYALKFVKTPLGTQLCVIFLLATLVRFKI